MNPARKILVVDDEMDMRIFVSTVLETGGYVAVVCRNGKEGFCRAFAEKPDLIILDVMMPDAGGVQMYKDLKTDPATAGIPVVMLSAVGEDGFAHYLNMLNVHLPDHVPPPAAYLEKPADPAELLDVVRRILCDG